MTEPNDDVGALEQQISVLRGQLEAKKLGRKAVDPKALQAVETLIVSYIRAVEEAERLISRRPNIKAIAEVLGFQPGDDYNAWLNSAPGSLRTALGNLRIDHDTVCETYHSLAVGSALLNYQQSAYKLMRILEQLHFGDVDTLEGILDKKLVEIVYEDYEDEDGSPTRDISHIEWDKGFEQWFQKHSSDTPPKA